MDLESHHECAWRPLAPVEEAGPLQPEINVIQLQILPLGFAFPAA